MNNRVTSLPERPRNYRFALTPLADAMFQLLIFFMLTSSLTPYSLVTLRGSPENTASQSTKQQVQDSNAQNAATLNANGPETTVWSLGNGVVIVNEQIFEVTQLPELAKAIGTQDNPGDIIIQVGDLARVQDVAAAIEALEAAEVRSVQIARKRSQ